MTITSFTFLGFVLATLIVYRSFPVKKQWWVLLAASIIFYLSFSIGGIFVMIGTSLLTYFSGIMVQKQKDKHYAWLKENKKMRIKKPEKQKRPSIKKGKS